MYALSATKSKDNPIVSSVQIVQNLQSTYDNCPAVTCTMMIFKLFMKIVFRDVSAR